MVEAGTIRALSKVMEIGSAEAILGLVAAALRCLTQVVSPKEASPKEGTGGGAGGGDGEDGGGRIGSGEQACRTTIKINAWHIYRVHIIPRFMYIDQRVSSRPFRFMVFMRDKERTQ